MVKKPLIKALFLESHDIMGFVYCTYSLKGAEIHPITHVAVMLCFFLLGHCNVLEAFLEKNMLRIGVLSFKLTNQCIKGIQKQGLLRG